MRHDLSVFWDKLETNVRFGGPRRHLRDLLGDNLELALERAGVLVYRRAAATYPCLQWAGAGCPRIVWHRKDGSVLVMCGHRKTPQCASIEMTTSDVDVLAVMPEPFAAAVGKALQIRVNVEEMTEIREVYRVGTFVPEPGVKHAVYYLNRYDPLDYSEAIDAMRFRTMGQTLAILVPSDRFISESVRREAAAAGVPVIALAESVGLADDRGFFPLVDPLRLFAGIGRPSLSSGVAAAGYVARALVREPGRAAVWRDLDQMAYRDLVRNTAAYDVFADEIMQTVVKKRGAQRVAAVRPWHFKLIRPALEKAGYYDPEAGDDDGLSAKQMFQRARQIFDIRRRNGWSVFQTSLVDNRALYNFAPSASVTFAFVFAANPGALPATSAVDDSSTAAKPKVDDTLVDRRVDDTLVDPRVDDSHTPVDTL